MTAQNWKVAGRLTSAPSTDILAHERGDWDGSALFIPRHGATERRDPTKRLLIQEFPIRLSGRQTPATGDFRAYIRHHESWVIFPDSLHLRFRPMRIVGTGIYGLGRGSEPAPLWYSSTGQMAEELLCAKVMSSMTILLHRLMHTKRIRFVSTPS